MMNKKVTTALYLLATTISNISNVLAEGPQRAKHLHTGLQRKLENALTESQDAIEQRRDLFLRNRLHPGSSCASKRVLLYGENLFNPQYSAFSYETPLPAPLDQDIYNLPLYDVDEYLNNQGNLIQIGSVQEQLTYLPPMTTDPDQVECLGREIWTFRDGQISDQYTCQAPGAGTVVTGGTGAYQCAQGHVELVDFTPGFFNGEKNTYIIWDLMTCNINCDM